MEVAVGYTRAFGQGQTERALVVVVSLFAAGAACQSGPGVIGATFHHGDASFSNFRNMHMALIVKGGAGGLPPGWDSLRGTVLVYDEAHTETCAAADETHWALFNPRMPAGPARWRTHRTLPGNPYASLQHPTGTGNLACSGHSMTADGRLFVAGGNDKHNFHIPGCIDGSRLVYLFDPTNPLLTVGNDLWVLQLEELDNKRWYPGAC